MAQSLHVLCRSKTRCPWLPPCGFQRSQGFRYLAPTTSLSTCSFGKLRSSSPYEDRGLNDARISASLTCHTRTLVYLLVSLICLSHTVQALVDSGATLNFIHEALVANLGLITQSCPLIKVRLTDGRIVTHTNRKNRSQIHHRRCSSYTNLLCRPLWYAFSDSRHALIRICQSSDWLMS